MRLILIRHAESSANLEGRLQGRLNYDLSEKGRQQAEQLFTRFSGEPLLPTHVYSSPLRRSMDTAYIVSRAWDLPIQVWDDLVEYDVGIFSGLTWVEITEKYPETAHNFERLHNWDLVEAAEPVRDRNRRGQLIVETILDRHHDNDVVLCFTHGGILQHILSAILGTNRTWGITVKNTGIFDFRVNREEWFGLGEVRLNTRYWRIAAFNDDGHLDKDLESPPPEELARDA